MFGYEDEHSQFLKGDKESWCNYWRRNNWSYFSIYFKTSNISPIVGSAVALAVLEWYLLKWSDGTKGIAIKPTEGVVYEPADAGALLLSQLVMHGLKAANGAEILIHVGIDSINERWRVWSK